MEVECNHSKGVQCVFNHLMCCLNVFSWFCSHSAAIIGPIGVIVSEETARCVLICLFYCSSTLSLDSISCNVLVISLLCYEVSGCEETCDYTAV